MNPPQSQLSNSSRGDCTPARGLTRRDFRSPDSVSACCLEKLSSLISAVLHTDDSAFPVHPSRGRTDKEAEIQERIKEIERGGREEEGRKKEGEGGERGREGRVGEGRGREKPAVKIMVADYVLSVSNSTL